MPEAPNNSTPSGSPLDSQRQVDPAQALVPGEQRSPVTEVEAIANRVLDKLDGEAKAAGDDYLSLVPIEHRQYVKGMAEDNYNGSRQYQLRFALKGGQDGFIQAMARNWEGKRRTFIELAKAGGFVEVTSHTPISELNAGPIVALTSSSSQVSIGGGAYNLQGGGASFEYVKIDLRHGTNAPSNQKRSSDAFLLTQPKVGKRLEVYTKTGVMKGRPEFSTSPLMIAYRIPASESAVVDAQALEDFSQDAHHSSLHIDSRFMA